jgi:hypothetical protein
VSSRRSLKLMSHIRLGLVEAPDLGLRGLDRIGHLINRRPASFGHVDRYSRL